MSTTETFHTDNKVDAVQDNLLTAEYELDRIEQGSLAAIWLSSEWPDARARIDIHMAGFNSRQGNDGPDY